MVTAPELEPTVVLGAGIAGLAAAYRLQQQQQVIVLEGSNRPGGTIRHEVIHRPEGTWRLEVGPNTVRLSPELRQLATELGLGPELVHPTGAHRRWILRNGTLRTVPMGPLSALTTSLLPFRAKRYALREGKRPTPDLSRPWTLHALMTERFGQLVADYLVDPFVAGVWAGNAHHLSAEYAFPQVWQSLQEHGSVLRGMKYLARARRAAGEGPPSIVSFRNGGLQRFTDALAATLGPALRLGSPVQRVLPLEGHRWRIELANGPPLETPRIISTVGTDATLAVFNDTPLAQLLEPLRDQPHPPVAMVHLGFNRTQLRNRLNGFGFLVPSSEPNVRVLGCIFPSVLFTTCAPPDHALLVAFVGGTRYPADAHLPEQQLVELVLNDLRPLLGITGKPVLSHISTWAKAIPQYDMAHGRRVEALQEAERQHPTLQLCGNYWGGIGVPDRLRAGLHAADRAGK